MAAREQPQDCPRCGAAASVQKLGGRRWKVECSKNAERTLNRCPDGHTMFTRSDAVHEWNKLK